LHSKLKHVARAAAGALVVALVATTTPVGGAQAFPPDPPFVDAVVLTPSSGTSSTGFTLAFPTPPEACAGGSDQGWRAHSFITPVSQDPGLLTFDGFGAPVGPGFTSSLRSPTGFVRNLLPSIPDGFITPPTTLLFSAGTFSTLPAGDYYVGFACVDVDLDPPQAVDRYWTQEVTVVSQTGAGTNNFLIGVPAAPAAPVTTTVTNGDTVATVNFTHAASLPATTGYTATVTPTAPAGPALPAIDLPAGSTSVNLTGLTNGTTYSVTVTATNSIDTSPPSNAATVTPTIAVPPAPVVSGSGGTNSVTVNWVAPASGPAPIGYTVTLTPTGAGAPVVYNATASEFTRVFTPLPNGAYNASVVAVYDAALGLTGLPGTAGPFNSNPSQLIVQEITVERPVGRLILTQRCGVNGELPAESAVNAFPGFPRNFNPFPASTDQLGTSPDIDLSTPTVEPDPGFNDPDGPNGAYPVPTNPQYPTRCGLDLGAGQLVTSGPLAGQYYTASGPLNQVTVSDFRDDDPGWTVTGTMGTFADGSNNFSGNYLGWTPVMTRDSGPTGAGYDQTVTAGAPVDPGTGIGGGPAGLAGGRTLASAPAGSGIGIADLNARVKLLIPATAAAGDYSGTLTFTVV
jgi:hypothetical protein